MDIKEIKKRLTQAKFTVPDQSFDIKCSGLKPYTRFYVVFDKFDYSDFCVQEGKNIGDPLISDGYGKLNLKFFWTRENSNLILENKNFSKLFDNSSGNKILTISDTSGSSSVTKTIRFTNNTPDVMFTRYLDAANMIQN